MEAAIFVNCWCWDWDLVFVVWGFGGVMEKELLEIFEVAKKAAEAAGGDVVASEEARCVDALKRLRDFPVTMSLLVSTQVIVALVVLVSSRLGLQLFFFLYV